MVWYPYVEEIVHFDCDHTMMRESKDLRDFFTQDVTKVVDLILAYPAATENLGTIRLI